MMFRALNQAVRPTNALGWYAAVFAVRTRREQARPGLDYYPNHSRTKRPLHQIRRVGF